MPGFAENLFWKRTEVDNFITPSHPPTQSIFMIHIGICNVNFQTQSFIEKLDSLLVIQKITVSTGFFWYFFSSEQYFTHRYLLCVKFD